MEVIRSVPALAAALRMTGQPGPHVPALTELRPRGLVPMYRLQACTIEQEIDQAAQVIEETAERLRRLATAYGEWRPFDAGPYFDLTSEQTDQLVYLVERVSSVHVRFFTDLLLPSFQRALRCWAQEYTPAYAGLRRELQVGEPATNHGLRAEPDNDHAFADTVQPNMIGSWQRVLAVIDGVHDRLGGEISLLSMNGSEEERNQWRPYWQLRPEAGLDQELLPALNILRTLTLTFDFPLPINRQPDRLRRLRFNRQRRQRHRDRGRSA